MHLTPCTQGGPQREGISIANIVINMRCDICRTAYYPFPASAANPTFSLTQGSLTGSTDLILKLSISWIYLVVLFSSSVDAGCVLHKFYLCNKNAVAHWPSYKLRWASTCPVIHGSRGWPSVGPALKHRRHWEKATTGEVLTSAMILCDKEQGKMFLTAPVISNVHRLLYQVATNSRSHLVSLSVCVCVFPLCISSSCLPWM